MHEHGQRTFAFWRGARQSKWDSLDERGTWCSRLFHNRGWTHEGCHKDGQTREAAETERESCRSCEHVHLQKCHQHEKQTWMQDQEKVMGAIQDRYMLKVYAFPITQVRQSRSGREKTLRSHSGGKHLKNQPDFFHKILKKGRKSNPCRYAGKLYMHFDRHSFSQDQVRIYLLVSAGSFMRSTHRVKQGTLILQHPMTIQLFVATRSRIWAAAPPTGHMLQWQSTKTCSVKRGCESQGRICQSHIKEPVKSEAFRRKQPWKQD